MRTMDRDFDSLEPFYQDDPFLFQDTTISCPDHHTIHLDHQDLQIHHHHPPSSNSLISTSPCGESRHQVATAAAKNKGKRLRKPSSTIQDDGDENPVDHDSFDKKAVHRDIERQRRQEMANLYASLRMLLPLEYIKGKRAITDHIHQAINYIKHMEKKIRELEVKRNSLRKYSLGAESDGDVQNSSAAAAASEARLSGLSSSNIAFTVSSCSGGGIEILMKSDLTDDWFPLSRVLNVLLNEGFTVVSCIYTKVDQQLHCTIQTDDEGGCLMNEGDLYSLQQKLDAKVIDWKLKVGS